ncbi:MAG TPA: peptidylprolyl isomerase [Acidimicrobiia bacterium]|nr:peptidylprolyl isomerase [Acidimicrobiia bacterium]
MIARPFRRVALPLVIGVVALGLAGCSNNSSDAATITYHDVSGDHVLHISRTGFKNELGQLVASAQFQTFLKANKIAVSGDQKGTTGSNLSAIWLRINVEQSAWDAEFRALRLKISNAATDRSAAEEAAGRFFALSSELTQDAQGNVTFKKPGAVYASLPKSLQNALVDRQLRIAAVASYYSQTTPAKEQALYDQFSGQICPSGKIVSQILVKTAAAAATVEGQLRGGASFASVARTKSIDPSGKTGGSLGCLRRNVYVKEFERASYAAQFAKPTQPVKSKFGYHVILVTRPVYADFRASISQALQQSPLVVHDLQLEAMHVKISPEFGTGALGVDSQSGALHFQVTPPTAPAVRNQREKPATVSSSTTTTTVPAGG